MLKKNEGITLIALIITVIVMMIIAAVTLSQITDSDGLMYQTQSAGESYNESSLEEEEYLTSLTNKWEQINNNIGN